MENNFVKKTKNCLILLCKCFYSSEIYSDYVEKNKINSIKILTISSLISALFISLNIFFVTKSIDLEHPHNKISQNLVGLIEQIPEIKIIDGKLYSNVEQPYYINLPNKRTFLSIDGFRSGSVSQPTPQENLKKNLEYKPIISLEKEKYSYGLEEDNRYSAKYSTKKINNFIFDADLSKKIILNIQSNIVKSLVVFSLISAILYNFNIIFKAIIFAFFANLYLRKSYRKILQLLILAFIPPTMMKIFYFVHPKTFIFPQIFFPFISFFYVFFAITSYRRYLRKQIKD